MGTNISPRTIQLIFVGLLAVIVLFVACTGQRKLEATRQHQQVNTKK